MRAGESRVRRGVCDGGVGIGRWRGGGRRLRSFPPPLQVSEVGRSDLHLGKLDGMLVALPVEPVDALGREPGQNTQLL